MSTQTDYQRQHYEANRERILARQKARREAVKAGLIEVPSHGNAGYSAGCRCLVCSEARRTFDAKKYAANADHRRATRRAHYYANRERNLEYGRRWYRANKERVAEYDRKRHEADREHFRQATAAWRQENPWAVRVQHMRGRPADGLCSPEQLKARWDYYGGRCWMCGGAANSVDHVVPLALGGTHWPANLRPACMSCNSTKAARHPSTLAVAQ